ncbi:hypothetical protein [Streptomyces sp. NPDC050560]|uniref:hypothetical protein n=1 Tax=Streptomyces sp. NPDC050560 TaxID=3365630 RepID=UPI00379CE0E5
MGVSRRRAGRRGEPGPGEERPGRRRLDLNVPQVAGSAVAAVVAAKLASNLGVYGTILGAGVVSILATCGGTIFQHFFRRTGEQLRDAAVQAKPRARQVPVSGTGRPVPDTFRPSPAPPDLPGGLPHPVRPEDDATALLPTAGAPDAVPPGEEDPGADPTLLLRPVPGPRPPADDATQVLRRMAQAPPPADGFGEATVHRAGRRFGWKRPLLAAGLVFAVTMGGITVYETASGHSFDGGGHGTTIGSVLTGGGSDTGPSHRPSDGPASTPGDSPSPSAPDPSDSATPGDGDRGGATTPSTPGGTRGTDRAPGATTDPGQDGSPGASPGGDGTTAPSEAPSESPQGPDDPGSAPGSGNGAQDQRQDQREEAPTP